MSLLADVDMLHDLDFTYAPQCTYTLETGERCVRVAKFALICRGCRRVELCCPECVGWIRSKVWLHPNLVLTCVACGNMSDTFAEGTEVIPL